MPISSVFGRIFIPQREIEAPTVALLQAWFPDFIHEIEHQLELSRGTVQIPKPENYTSRNKFDAMPGEMLPKVVVISPGIVGTPQHKGNGQITATWRLGIGVAHARPTEEEAKLHCDIYGAAVRDIMLKKGGGALHGRVHWLDEQYTDLPIGDQLQQYRAAAIWFSIDIENVATKRGGPATPNSEPYVYPLVQDVDITLQKEAI